MKIEALHEFHDAEYAQEWSDRFDPSKERLEMFETISQQIRIHSDIDPNIVELGIGPGYLALYLLRRLPGARYTGIDFSEHMLEIASKRLQSLTSQAKFLKEDLTSAGWINRLAGPPDYIVSTWALHDLLSEANIQLVYECCFKILPTGGKLLNADFIQPEDTNIEYEKGRLKPSRHIEILKKIGFKDVQCLRYFETNMEVPTTANNYACFQAIK